MEKKTYKVISILQKQSGRSERGEWCSQEIIIESTEQVQYPDRFLLRLSGSNVDLLQGIKEGDIVEALWSSSVRSFQRKDGSGNSYTQENRCWKIIKRDQPF